MNLTLLAIKPARAAIQRISNPRPLEPPPGYPIWPRWFSRVCFVHNRVFSNYLVLSLIVDTVIRTVCPGFWRSGRSPASLPAAISLPVFVAWQAGCERLHRRASTRLDLEGRADPIHSLSGTADPCYGYL